MMIMIITAWALHEPAGGGHRLTGAAWGDNSAEQMVVPAGLSDVVAIATGSSHYLALVASIRVDPEDDCSVWRMAYLRPRRWADANKR